MSALRIPFATPVATAAFAILLGAMMDGIIKHVTASQSLVTIVFWRFAIGTLVVSVPYFLSGRRLPGWEATRFHAFRGAVHICAAFLFFYSLGLLKLAEATTLGFSSALMVGPMARVILGEKLSKWAGLAAVIGFAGVAITVWGGEQEAMTPERLRGVIACLSASAFYALSLVLLRARAAKDGNFTVAVYANLFPAIYIAPFAIIFAPLPSLDFMPVLFFIGVMGSSIWILMTSAYARAPAQRLAPLEYSALVWSAILGWAFFSEVPGWQLWAGALVIIAACLIVVIEDYHASRTEARAHVSEGTDV